MSLAVGVLEGGCGVLVGVPVAVLVDVVVGIAVLALVAVGVSVGGVSVTAGGVGVAVVAASYTSATAMFAHCCRYASAPAGILGWIPSEEISDGFASKYEYRSGPGRICG